MIIMQSEQLKEGQKEKRARNFHENFDLNVSAQELDQQTDSELYGKIEKHKDNIGMEAQNDECRNNIFEGCADHLLILAQSAEMVEAQSRNSVAMPHTNNKSTDQECSHELHDRLSTVSHASEKCRPGYEATRIRLTQIRKQARCKYLSLDQKMHEDNQGKHSPSKTIRLSQIKNQARCKSKNHLKAQMISGPRNEHQRGRILRLSEMKRLARSRNNSMVKEVNEEHESVNQHCNRFRVCATDSNVVVVGGVPAYNFCYRGAVQSAAARSDDVNRRECQRAARRLRVFKTKKHRQQLRTCCIRSSADISLNDLKLISSESSSMANSQLQTNSATSQKDKDLITCQRELPETSGCTEIFKANFDAKKFRGHDGSNESSSELRNKSLHHIPSQLRVQNSVALFSGLPIYTFQQYDPNMGWMLHTHHVQHKLQDAARRHRAERIEEKRALKYKQHHSTNLVLGNSEAQKELLPAKRLSLTQLRREARSGNRSIIQEPEKIIKDVI